MRCFYCGSYQVKVIDSRHAGGTRKRRYRCNYCGGRFNTYEQYETESMETMEKGYSIVQAAEAIGIKVRTVREWIRTGKIKAYKREGSNRWIIPEGEIQRARGDRT